jgi:hypothetical protein
MIDVEIFISPWLGGNGEHASELFERLVHRVFILDNECDAGGCGSVFWVVQAKAYLSMTLGIENEAFALVLVKLESKAGTIGVSYFVEVAGRIKMNDVFHSVSSIEKASGWMPLI